MWLTQDIVAWIASLGVTVPLLPGPYMPRSPDLLGVVTRTSGPGLTTEDVLDTGGFQLRIRGSQGYSPDSEAAAADADRRIVFADLPATFRGNRIVSVTRSGGPPTVLSPAPDDAERITWVCTYLPTIAS